MRFPVGATVAYRRETWQVVGYRKYPRTLRFRDGRRIIHGLVDRLRPAP